MNLAFIQTAAIVLAGTVNTGAVLEACPVAIPLKVYVMAAGKALKYTILLVPRLVTIEPKVDSVKHTFSA